MTRAEQERYRGMGIETPFLQWGIHPEYDEYVPNRAGDRVDIHYHAGLLGKRKPFKEIIEAFRATSDPSLRLIVKGQIERRMNFLERRSRRTDRIELMLEDLPTDQHLQLFADSHVCMAPARWEGLGLHLYEAIAFGMPIVCNDDAPMNELITDGVNGTARPLLRGRPRQLRHPRQDRRRSRPDGGDRATRRPGPARGALRKERCASVKN